MAFKVKKLTTKKHLSTNYAIPKALKSCRNVAFVDKLFIEIALTGVRRQIVFQKEGRKQVIVESKKQESPLELTAQKKEVKTSTIDLLASSNNNLEEEGNNQSINIEVDYNSPSLINNQIKKDIKNVRKNKKRDPKKSLKTDKKDIRAFIFSILVLLER